MRTRLRWTNASRFVGQVAPRCIIAGAHFYRTPTEPSAANRADGAKFRSVADTDLAARFPVNPDTMAIRPATRPTKFR